MPGIAGIIGSADPAQKQAQVRAMLATMQHEPDWVSAIYSAAELGVCAGWVNRVGSCAADESNLQQQATQLSLSFCGEYFEDVESGSATLRQRYAKQGDAFVAGLNGLFSGLLVDRSGGKVLLFNDRFGCERIYHHRHAGSLYFASEAKALLAVLPHLRTLDDRSVADVMAYGCTLEGRTLFRGVDQVPAASLWTFGSHGKLLRQQRYFEASEWEQQPALDHDAFCDELTRTFCAVLPRYLTTPSAIGLSVTGGLDTRMILAAMAAEQATRTSYTYAGLEGRTLDCRIGAQAAALRGIGHHVLRIGPDFLTHYVDYLDRAVHLTDGGAGALGCHEVYYSTLARQLAPIRLTGNFGGEVLRGISTMRPIRLDAALFDPDFLRSVTAAADEGESVGRHPVTQAAFREVPWHLFGTPAAARAVLTVRTPFLDNELVKLAYRAPTASGRSVDPALRLIATTHPGLAAMPTDRGHSARPSRAPALMRRLATGFTFKLDYLHKEGLPDWLSRLDGAVDSLSTFGLLGWHKYLPYRRWFREELASPVREIVANASRRGLHYWSRPFLESLVDDHVQGRANRMREINAVLNLDAVDRLFIREVQRAKYNPAPQQLATTS